MPEGAGTGDRRPEEGAGCHRGGWRPAREQNQATSCGISPRPKSVVLVFLSAKQRTRAAELGLGLGAMPSAQRWRSQILTSASGDAIWGVHIDLIPNYIHGRFGGIFFVPQVPPAPRCTPVVISTKLTSRLSLAPCCACQPSFGHIQAAPRRALAPVLSRSQPLSALSSQPLSAATCNSNRQKRERERGRRGGGGVRARVRSPATGHVLAHVGETGAMGMGHPPHPHTPRRFFRAIPEPGSSLWCKKSLKYSPAL
jgi:hypothetical protein